jgi:hypothetical protein
MQHFSKYTDMPTGIFSEIHRVDIYLNGYVDRYMGRWLRFWAGGRRKRRDDYGHTYVSCGCVNAQVGSWVG